VKSDVPDEDEAAKEQTSIGVWPKIAPLPKGSEPADIEAGMRQLLGYLQDQEYCKGYEVSDIQQEKDGKLKFVTYVREPVNLEATASLMRSNDNFAPRYDQRVLQAFFADHGYAAEFSDSLADSIQAVPGKGSPSRRPSGVRCAWTLLPDADAGL